MERYIKRFELQKVLPKQMLEHITLSNFKKGDYIFTQGEEPKYMHFLVEGRLKIFAATDDDKKLVIAFTQPFGVFGDIEFVQKRPYLNTGEAVTDVKMLKIPMKIVNEFGRLYFPFINFLLNVITRKFYENSHAQSFNMLYSADVRFASYLLSSTTENETDVSLANIRDVADSLGTSYRHLNRIIAQFSELGYVERADRKIRILNRPELYILAKQNIYEER